MALQLMAMGFADVAALRGGYREWLLYQFPADDRGPEPRQECITCHMDVTPAIVQDWKLSKHAENEVTCGVCHGDLHSSGSDVDKTMPVHPDRCGMCHEPQSDQFKKGKHSKAWGVMTALPAFHHMPVGFGESTKGCGGCHRIGYKSQTQIKELKKSGAGYGYVSCDVCHTRHTFSKKEASQPQACQTCHMGFDHAQWEMYSSSKHGVRFTLRQMDILPKEASAPSCQTCHMPHGDHEVRTSWGFLGVALPMPEDKQWADARATILQALGLLDLKGRPTPRFDIVKKYDMARTTYDDWLMERVKMLRTCNKCHAFKFATSEVEKGDLMIRQADLLLSDAIRIVANLYKEGLLKKPKGYAYPFPDFLALHDAPTEIEQKLWVMFQEHRMRAFQGSFHMNPDFAFWYGYSQMQQDLVGIKEMASEVRRRAPKGKRMKTGGGPAVSRPRDSYR